MGFSRQRILEWVAYYLLQGILLTQGLKPCLLCFLHWQAGSLALVPPEKLAFRRAARQLVLRALLPFLPVSMACELKATSQVKVS